MPSSRPDTIPSIISLLRQARPSSILDVGVGFGKWGVLFREYTDIVASERDNDRYCRDGWQVRIEGVEGYPDYLTDLHKFIYDAIHVGNVIDVLPKLGKYEMIFFGDMLEHLDKGDGEQLVLEALKHTLKYLIITTPVKDTKQGPLCGNALERHRSLWRTADFMRLGNADVFRVPGDMLVVVYRIAGNPRIGPRGYRRLALRRFVCNIARSILGRSWCHS